MAIIRKCNSKGKRTAEKIADDDAKKLPSRERHPKDFDLAFGEKNQPIMCVYLLDEGEHFDPRTSTKGRHMMHGPAFITTTLLAGSVQTRKSHVNDPTAWQWLTRCIAEGHLTQETICHPHDEKSVVWATAETDKT